MTPENSRSAFDRHPKLTLISITAALIVAVVALAEIGLRFTDAGALLGSGMHFPGGMVKSDPDLAYDLAPNFGPATHVFADSSYTVFSNEFSCFDRPFEDDEPYVLLLGDSFTWGYTPFEAKWGSVLEEALGRRVYKCGVPGFGAQQSASKGRSLIARLGRSPDLIVYGYFMNDVEDDFFFPKEAVIDGHLVSTLRPCESGTPCLERYDTDTLRKRYESMLRYGRPDGETLAAWQQLLHRSKQILKQHSVLARLIRRSMVLSQGAPQGGQLPGDGSDASPSWVEDAWDSHEVGLRAIQRLSVESEAELLVVMIPEREHVYETDDTGVGPTAKRYERARSLLQELGIHYLSLLEPFQARARAYDKPAGDQEEDLYWRDDSHWNVAGNSFAGMLAARMLLEQKLVDGPSREERLVDVNSALEEYAEKQRSTGNEPG
jgi:hypothetical protein